MEILTFERVYSYSVKGEKKLLIKRSFKTGDVNISPFRVDDIMQTVNIALSAEEAEELKKFLNENT